MPSIGTDGLSSLAFTGSQTVQSFPCPHWTIESATATTYIDWMPPLQKELGSHSSLVEWPSSMTEGP